MARQVGNEPRIIPEPMMGHSRMERLSALSKAMNYCEREFSPPGRVSMTPALFNACAAGAEEALRRLPGGSMKGMNGLGKIKGIGLGYFSECAIPCPKGFEKVAVKKNPKTGQKLICVCRLDPTHRRRFTSAEDVKRFADKPIGKWKDPQHLRRQAKYRPGLTDRDLEERPESERAAARSRRKERRKKK